LKKFESASGKTAINQRIRRSFKDTDGTYFNGIVIGWIPDGKDVAPNGTVIENVALFHALYDNGIEEDLICTDVVQGIICASEHAKAKRGRIEKDAPFLSYKNTLGNFSESKREPHLAAAPMQLCKIVWEFEARYYKHLKAATKDNTWGGKEKSHRDEWIAAIKKCTTLKGVREAMLQLESNWNMWAMTTVKGSNYKEPLRYADEYKKQDFEASSKFMTQFDFLGDGDVCRSTDYVMESLWSDENTRKGWRACVKWSPSLYVMNAMLDRFADRVSKFCGVDGLEEEPETQKEIYVEYDTTSRSRRTSRNKQSYKEYFAD